MYGPKRDSSSKLNSRNEDYQSSDHLSFPSFTRAGSNFHSCLWDRVASPARSFFAAESVRIILCCRPARPSSVRVFSYGLNTSNDAPGRSCESAECGGNSSHRESSLYSGRPRFSHDIVQIVTAIAMLSTISLLLVLLRIAWISGHVAIQKKLEVGLSREMFFKTQLGMYVTCLLASNLLSSISGIMGMNWVASKEISGGTVSFIPGPRRYLLNSALGSICTTQG